MQEENSEQEYEKSAESPQIISNEDDVSNMQTPETSAGNPLETISQSYDFDNAPALSEKEIDRTLSINSLTNEEIDARLQKLGEELEERWQKRSKMIKDLEELGPASSRVEILAQAIADEFETPENAIGFVKMLLTKGGLTPQQKIAEELYELELILSGNSLRE